MSGLFPVPIEPVPGWVLIYAVVVLVLSFVLAWYLDRRDNDRTDAERMRRHLAAQQRQDTYLDPAGWQQ